MSSFTIAIESFLDAINDEQSWVEELNVHLQKVSALYSEASAGEINDSLRRLASFLPNLRLVALGHVAITCGSLVERGGDPEIAGPSLLEKLTVVNEAVLDFYHRCRARAEWDKELIEELRPAAIENADEDIGPDGLTPAAIIEDHVNNEGWQGLAQRFGPELFEICPTSVLGHMADEYFRLGLIAHLSRSKKLRRAAREQSGLLEQTRTVDKASGTERSFLITMLRVLDDEQLLILHVEQKKGFVIRISGIADNFQLHTLLAGAIIGSPSKGMVTGEAPSSLAVAQCKDTAVGEAGGEHVTGPFNLWNWGGIQADGRLPAGQAGMRHWIWGEGSPADILPFEDRRMVLVGPPPFGRSWVAGRTFCGMAGEMKVERQLSDSEVAHWVTRIAQAAHPAQSSAGSQRTPFTSEAASNAKPWWKFF
ncbi:hypothetical protein [Massilia sp. CF038]|uniref:hypothetical protein n=1 Tax=Massilia sp. CF038 TaxID=1881045 RepID=UPI000920ABDA|nr:hypothetical protein [Massilia sp. CF038]SHH10436.1 hypothetical protein SAMN05428948_2790 [Massilia sp. CF038]